MNDLRKLENNLGIQFDDYSLLRRAITHRSFLNENPTSTQEDNERLEFLGDAVLDFVVAGFLFDRFPEMDEGQLTMLRSALVRTKTLAGFAQNMGIGEALLLGIGEADGGGRERPPNLCAAFEAIVGAIYLDQGMAAVQSWITELIPSALDEILDKSAHIDAKSEFQIWAQAHYNLTPTYHVTSEEGPDHDKTFAVAVLVGNEIWGTGKGRSKQTAAQEAASLALEVAVKLESSPG
jgi:ribonuclease-3